MPAVVRLGDKCSGHGCFSPRPNEQASADTFANGKGVHRVGDKWKKHTCVPPVGHPGTLSQGSPDTFVNGKAAGRVGDPVDCGSVCAEGSADVFVN